MRTCPQDSESFLLARLRNLDSTLSNSTESTRNLPSMALASDSACQPSRTSAQLPCPTNNSYEQRPARRFQPQLHNAHGERVLHTPVHPFHTRDCPRIGASIDFGPIGTPVVHHRGDSGSFEPHSQLFANSVRFERPNTMERRSPTDIHEGQRELSSSDTVQPRSQGNLQYFAETYNTTTTTIQRSFTPSNNLYFTTDPALLQSRNVVQRSFHQLPGQMAQQHSSMAHTFASAARELVQPSASTRLAESPTLNPQAQGFVPSAPSRVFQTSRMLQNLRGQPRDDGRRALGINYLGDINGNTYRNQVPHLPLGQNCSIWGMNLPACTYAELFDFIREGSVRALDIKPVTLAHDTHAFTLEFKNPESAVALLARAHEMGGLVFKGHLLDLRLNKHGVLRCNTEETRVLIIDGPACLVNQKYLKDLFDEACVYNVDRWLVRESPGPGLCRMEVRFARVVGQSESCQRMLDWEPAHKGLLTVRYGPDPCDPNNAWVNNYSY